MDILKRFGSLFKTKIPASKASGNPVASPARSFTITRVYDVGRHKVWDMWTKPEKLAEWWGVPPLAATKESSKVDLRVGGEWQADMVNEKDGTSLPFRGTFLEIDPPRKLVFTLKDPFDPENPDVETITVTFNDHAGTTQMTMHQEGHLPPEQYAGPLQQGYGAFFDRMARYLRLHQD